MILLNGFLPVLFGGMLGALLLELIKIAAWRDATKIARKYRQLRYWLATLALFVVSGLVAVINGVEQVPLIDAVQLGVNAPAIIAGYATASAARQQMKRERAGFIAGAATEVAPPSRAARVAELLSW